MRQTGPLIKLFCRNFATEKFSSAKFLNPIAELMKNVEGPIFHEDEISFQPSTSHMKFAEEIFSDFSGQKIRLVKKIRTHETQPDFGLPEFAFMGFSNVGKSSLIKAMFHRCNGLKIETSKNPGHTKSVNFFKVHDSFILVDMPGYGLNQPAAFAKAVGSYLQVRRGLHTIFLLFDPEAGVRNEDVIIMRKLEEMDVSYALIMTKIDLFPPSKRLKILMEVRKLRDTFGTENCFAQPFLVSSKTGEGIGYLQTFIAHLCGRFD